MRTKYVLISRLSAGSHNECRLNDLWFTQYSPLSFSPYRMTAIWKANMRELHVISPRRGEVKALNVFDARFCPLLCCSLSLAEQLSEWGFPRELVGGRRSFPPSFLLCMSRLPFPLHCSCCRAHLSLRLPSAGPQRSCSFVPCEIAQVSGNY